MASISEWALARIAECAPTPEASRESAKLNDLLAAQRFFEGRGSLLFGMVCDPSALENRDALARACEEALRGWAARLVKTDADTYTDLYRALTAAGGFTDLTMPPALAANAAAVRARNERLEALHAPLVTLSEYEWLVDDLRALAEMKVWFDAIEGAAPLDTGHVLTDFCYFVAPEWSEIAGLYLPPDFLPIADAGSGDYLGVLLDVKLLGRGLAPIVMYFHEQAPTYTWAIEDVAVLRRAFDAIASGATWSDALRGQCADDVRDVLQDLNDADEQAPSPCASRTASRRWLRDADAAFSDEATLDAYRRDDHRYAVAHLEAQKIWVAADTVG